jgi:peptidoglycan/LPS O-acetylase OafA/YrhL
MLQVPIKRIDELDALRGIATFLVVIYHYTFRFQEYFQYTFITDKFNFKYGHYGVELFFVISGFVIFMSIEHTNDPLNFLYKRFLRLYPTFLMAMIFSYLFIAAFGPAVLKVSIFEFLVNFTMAPSFFNIKAVDGVYWTLKVETAFYLAVAFAIFIKKKESYKFFGYIFLLVGLLSFIIIKPNLYFYYGSLFLAGINFYKIWKNDSDYQNHFQIIVCLIFSLFYPTFELFVVTGIIVAIFYLTIFNKFSFINLYPLLFLGQISYSLYLIHQYFGYIIQLKLIHIGVENFLILLIVPFLLSVGLASALTFFVENPILKNINIKSTKTIY